MYIYIYIYVISNLGEEGGFRPGISWPPPTAAVVPVTRDEYGFRCHW